MQLTDFYILSIDRISRVYSLTFDYQFLQIAHDSMKMLLIPLTLFDGLRKGLSPLCGAYDKKHSLNSFFTNLNEGICCFIIWEEQV